MQETLVKSLGWKDPLEEEMAIHSSILAWRIPWTEELGGLQSMGSQRVRHDWASNTHTHTSLFIHGAYDSGISCLTSFLEEEKKVQTREEKAVGLWVQSPLSLVALWQGWEPWPLVEPRPSGSVTGQLGSGLALSLHVHCTGSAVGTPRPPEEETLVGRHRCLKKKVGERLCDNLWSKFKHPDYISLEILFR